MSIVNDNSGSEKGKEVVVASFNNVYPQAVAQYDDVVLDRNLFRNTLEKLHTQMGTKFMIPTIGGKELDLHRLFVEVTSRGGIEKVIHDRKWREVTAAFRFPSTATNASFVLRKYYISLLQHYEQVYFFRRQGWSSQSTACLSTPPSATSVLPKNYLEPLGPSASPGPSLSQINKSVTGVIDGKFEDGYFVSVMVGTQKLKGVLFHTQDKTTFARAQLAGFANNTTPVVGRRRRRKKLSTRDPNHPKPNRSGYNFFFSDQHARLRQIHSGKDREISKMIGDLWNKLSETDKAVYQEQGVKDKERYRRELAVYKEKQKMGNVVNNVTPIQQLPLNKELVADDTDTKMAIDEDGDSFSEESGSDEEDDFGPDVGVTPVGTESNSLTAEPSNEGDDFEIRRRESPVKVNAAPENQTASEDADSKKQ